MEARAANGAVRMGRLTPIGPDGLDADQQLLWNNVTNGSRAGAVGSAPASLPGPFDPWLRAAGPGFHAAKIGELLLHRGTLDARLRELAILAVAAHHHADLMFAAHVRVARKSGLGGDAIDAVRDGRELPSEDADVAAVTVLAATRQLLEHGRWDDPMYGALCALLGERERCELVMIAGYYTLVSYTVAAFEVDLPAGMEPVWPRVESGGGRLDTAHQPQ